MLIGLQLPSISGQLGDTSLGKAILYGLIISFVLVLTRLVSTLGASLFTRLMSHLITVADPNPGWRGPVILGWAGMRGVVSLAAALSIPLMVSEDQPFPLRNLILFITFIVILVTLVFQGLTLPWLIRRVELKDNRTIPEHQQELIIQKKIARASLQFLEEEYGKDRVQNEHLDNLLARLQIDLRSLDQKLQGSSDTKENSSKSYQSIYLELLEQQRLLLSEMNRLAEFDEELIRKYLSLIDIEELKIREKQLQVSGSEQ